MCHKVLGQSGVAISQPFRLVIYWSVSIWNLLQKRCHRIQRKTVTAACVTAGNVKLGMWCWNLQLIQQSVLPRPPTPCFQAVFGHTSVLKGHSTHNTWQSIGAGELIYLLALF